MAEVCINAPHSESKTENVNTNINNSTANNAQDIKQNIGGEQDQVQRSKVYNISLILTLASIAFNQGYFSTIFNPLGIPYLENKQGITDTNEQSQILGNLALCYCFLSGVGCILAGYLTSKIGRRNTVIFMEGMRIPVCLLYCINNLTCLYFVRS